MISIVIPAYNEERRLGESLARLLRFREETALPAEILVVDDGSEDGTLRVAREATSTAANVRVLSLGAHRGKGAAVLLGLREARRAWVLWMDADLSVGLENVAAFLHAMRGDADLLVGSKHAPGAVALTAPPLPRLLASRAFAALTAALLRLPVADTQCGFKAIRKAALGPVLPRLTIDGFTFDAEVILTAHRLGLRIVEIPVRWAYRQGTSVRLSTGLRAVLDLIRIAGRARRIVRPG